MSETAAARTIPRGARLSTWRAPDGLPLRRFDRAVPDAKGRILFQTGRGDFIEKYLETYAHLASRGWSVTAFDWRGQGGSGRLSSDPRAGHATDLRTLVDDLAAFWRDWTEGPGPHVAIGHSMGGHLIHRAIVEHMIDPDGGVLVAPMMGLASPLGSTLSGLVARFMARRGDPARPAWRGGERPGATVSRRSLLTHDETRYADEQFWLRERPELRTGPPSWSWLAAAFASTALVAADDRTASVTTPMLVLIADADRLVDARAARRIARRMRDVRIVHFGAESAHEILREADPVRDRALAEIDAFLDERVRSR